MAGRPAWAIVEDTMRVLVITASKHGSTAEIGTAIAAGLTRRGVPADHLPVDRVRGVDGYDAVVLGSAVYAGQWVRAARDLALDRGAWLRTRPVWLFSSGRVDERPEEDAPLQLDELLSATGAVAHRTFAGRIDRRRLSLPEKALIAALRVREGDFRDWDAIDAYADDIATHLVGVREPLAVA